MHYDRFIIDPQRNASHGLQSIYFGVLKMTELCPSLTAKPKGPIYKIILICTSLASSAIILVHVVRNLYHSKPH